MDRIENIASNSSTVAYVSVAAVTLRLLLTA
jgi:hypothetical protein